MMTDLEAPKIRGQFSLLYASAGRALARWQDVEMGLFLVVHARLGTDARLSSLVFFHIKSQSTKAELADRLWRHNRPTDRLPTWLALYKRVTAAVQSRNYLAHFETSWIEYREPKPDGTTEEALLVPHHLDFLAWGKDQVTGMNSHDLDAMGSDWHQLALDLAHEVLSDYKLSELHPESLPPRLAQFLQNIEFGLRSQL